jgi:hydrogenase maturation factor
MLGVSPIYLANEGSLAIICDLAANNLIVSILQQQAYGKNAVAVGKVAGEWQGVVWLVHRPIPLSRRHSCTVAGFG